MSAQKAEQKTYKSLYDSHRKNLKILKPTKILLNNNKISSYVFVKRELETIMKMFIRRKKF